MGNILGFQIIGNVNICRIIKSSWQKFDFQFFTAKIPVVYSPKQKFSIENGLICFLLICWRFSIYHPK